MHVDDFNMYFSGSYLETNDGGNLFHVGDCNTDGLVSGYLFRAPEDYKSISYDLDEIEGIFKLSGFPLKPFKAHTTVFSPSYKTLRGYKDGVSLNRVDFNPVLKPGDEADIPCMFFEKVFSLEEGLGRIAAGGSSYAGVEDEFLLIKVEDKFKDTPPFEVVSVFCTRKDHYVYKDTSGLSFDIKPNSDISSFEDMPCHLYIKYKHDIECFSRFLEERVSSEYEGSIPTPLLNSIIEWEDKLTAQGHEVPAIEVYRQGCKITTLGSTIDPLFKGLPKLTALIERLNDGYSALRRS
jgi:hypothetical protein